MKRRSLFTICIILALVLGFAKVNPALAAYTLIDLGALDYDYSKAVAINEAGQVVGYAYDLSNSKAFLWEDGVMTELGPFSNAPVAINEAGQVIGSFSVFPNGSRAFLWENGVMTDLGTLGYNHVEPVALNEAGQVIGIAYLPWGNGPHAFEWENGVITDLGTFGGAYSYPVAINEAGQVIGYAQLVPWTGTHAFLWDDGVMTDLGTLGGSNSQPVAINEAGQVIGYSDVAGNASYHAFLWEDGVLTDLGSLGYDYSRPVAINEAGQVIAQSQQTPWSGSRAFLWQDGVVTELGDSNIHPVAINEAGQVIGTMNVDPSGLHAFVWQDGVMTDLGTFGGMSSEVAAINEAGQVIGTAWLTGNNARHAFVTSYTNRPPTPEAGGPYSVDEGASISVTASGDDLEAGALAYAWDLDNDGTFETPGQSATFSAAALDGPSTNMINVQVTDEGGLTATDQATVDVLNVAPTATFTTTSAKIIEGQSVTLSFSNPFDPGTADTAAGFLHSYDCTNDGNFEQVNTLVASYTCTYTNSGTFSALGRIADKDGGFTDYAVPVKVLTPREGTAGLIDQVQALIPGSLNGGQGNALIVKLQAAIQRLDQGQDETAINQLEAFVHQASAMIRSGVLSAAEGQPLIEAANTIIAALGS
jgi:probable HAF family extracellular repeat protein